MPYVILGIIILVAAAGIYTYITGRILFTKIEGRKYGHYFMILAICLAEGGYLYTHTDNKGDNTFTTVHLVVRDGPGYNHKVLGFFYPGQAFRVVDKGGHWAKVAGNKKNVYGWVFADDLQSISRLDTWMREQQKMIQAKSDSILASNPSARDTTIKRNDYEEARLLLKQLHDSHGLKYIDVADNRAYFDDYLWTRRMNKQQKNDYLEMLSDYIGYKHNHKKRVYIRIINYRTGEVMGAYLPGKGSVINQ